MRVCGTLLAVLAAAVGVVDGCTSVIMRCKDGTNVIGRTMELGIPFLPSELSSVYIKPRGTPIITTRGNVTAAAYGFVAIQFDVDGYAPQIGTTEGINEAGLTVSAQIHSASYEDANASKVVAMYDVTVTAFLLACCSNVNQAATELAKVNVVTTPDLGWLGTLHWHVQDASGQSRVFEYINHELRVYDNTAVGVLTNDPSYEWQLGYLNQFGAYPSSIVVPAFKYTADSSGPFSEGHSVPTTVSNDTFHTTVPYDSSHGTATRMLPGSFTPPDRFVRMFLLKQMAHAHSRPAEMLDGIAAVTGLLNNVHLIRGTISSPSISGVPILEYTNWAVIKIPRPVFANTNSTAPRFLYRTYDNMQWKSIDLGKLNFAPTATYAPLPLFEAGLGIRDATPAPQ